MNLEIEHTSNAAIVRVNEPKLMYPMLTDFSDAVAGLVDGGDANVVIDMTGVGYIDSASIGCLMDLHRQASAAGGALKLMGVQKRVETMLTMTGTLNFITLHETEADACGSFRR